MQVPGENKTAWEPPNVIQPIEEMMVDMLK